MHRYSALLPIEQDILRQLVAFCRTHKAHSFTLHVPMGLDHSLALINAAEIEIPARRDCFDHLATLDYLFASDANHWMLTQSAYNFADYDRHGKLWRWQSDLRYDIGDGKAAWPKIVSGLIGYAMGVGTMLLANYLNR